MDCDHAVVDSDYTHTHTHTHTYLRIESTLLTWFAVDSDIMSLHITSLLNHDIYATPSFSVVNLYLKLWMQSSVGPKVLCIRCGKIKKSINLKLRFVCILCLFALLSVQCL
jgi:hypothetical protein